VSGGILGSMVAVARGDLATADARIADDLAIAREFDLLWDEAIAPNGTGELRCARGGVRRGRGSLR